MNTLIMGILTVQLAIVDANDVYLGGQMYFTCYDWWMGGSL